MQWYEEEVQRVVLEWDKLAYEPRLIFYGSSSIRLWQTLYSDFSAYQPINLGFGGSTLAACDWFFKRIMRKCNPAHIVFYAGDNDLGDGRNPEEVYLFFKQLLVLVQEQFTNVPVSFVSIKPSIARWQIIEKIRCTNKIIEDVILATGGHHYFINIFDTMLGTDGKPNASYFDLDGLHLSALGYTVWKDAITSHLQNLSLIQYSFEPIL